MEKNLDMLKKLKELAEHGSGGEKENARILLERLMKKYGVQEADLSDDALENHEFRYHSPQERMLLLHVFDKIIPERRWFRYTRGKGCQTTLGCTCTRAEALRLQIEYEFYLDLWHEELEMFLVAFIQKHRIFTPTPGGGTCEFDEDYLRRMSAMIAGMQDKTLHPLLEMPVNV